MERYYLDVKNRSQLGVTYYDANSKPYTDSCAVAERLGFKPMTFYCTKLKKQGEPIWKKVVLHAYNEFNRFKLLRETQEAFKDIHGAEVFVQGGFAPNNIPDTLRKIRENGNKVILLAHDLETLREGRFWDLEKKIVRNCDVVIAHSQPMADFVREKLEFKGEIVLLEFFDYHNSFKPELCQDCSNINIVYAGNLAKSVFIKELHKIASHDNMHFHLYGVTDNSFVTNDHVIYKGKFQADDIAAIDGNWSLVWDGTSLDSCTGNFGEYLRYNAPFKFSLSMASGMPVIAWEESAMAYYVKKYNIGIAVKSLHEIYDKISALTIDEQMEIRRNVLAVSEKVRNGMMLENALNKITYSSSIH